MIFSEEVKAEVGRMNPGEVRAATLHGKSHRAYRSHLPFGMVRTWVKDGVLYVQRLSDMTEPEYADMIRTRAIALRDGKMIPPTPVPPHIRGNEIIREVAQELGMQIVHNAESGFFDAQLPPNDDSQRERRGRLKYFDVDNGDL